MRRRLTVRGAVQGVGFRPFVYLLAREMGLAGWVSNTPTGAEVQIEGSRELLDLFEVRLSSELPPPGEIATIVRENLQPTGEKRFEIHASEAAGERDAWVLPDLATCPACLAEMRDPNDRRFGYPFVNCTYCGPRYSIIRNLPYDRVNTSMAGFQMCEECRAEYENPADRRFHAQPIACPRCGPQLSFQDSRGRELASRGEALELAAQALLRGEILALQGLGGFHLMVDARDEEAVCRLRERKHRDAKPLAIMATSVEQAEELACFGEVGRRALLSRQAPIVIARKREFRAGDWVFDKHRVAPSVAPDSPGFGVMLPYTPLHHLLLERCGIPLVATSGNLSDEPICVDPQEALARLGDVADAFLVHDRPIVRPVDDSVVRAMAGRAVMVRMARGYAPVAAPLPGCLPGIVAVGPHMKNSMAISRLGEVVLSQHIGDLDTISARERLAQTERDLARLYDSETTEAIADVHPDYGSSHFAESLGVPITRVQHHLAHALSCLADNEWAPPALAVVWDGTGLGEDGTI